MKTKPILLMCGLSETNAANAALLGNFEIVATSVIALLGFVAYGLSINFYILAQRKPGTAKTAAFYSIAPFLGVLFSFVLLGERPVIGFYIGCILMAAATVLLTKESLRS